MMNSLASPASRGAATRAHACVLCQQRKVKCSRESPCSGCIKSRAECVYRDPAPPRRRKRRSPGDNLLDRLKRYEKLLQNAGINIDSISRADGGAVGDGQADDFERGQSPGSENASRSEGGEHDASTIPAVSGSLSTDKTNVGRFIFDEGRSRYLEK